MAESTIIFKTVIVLIILLNVTYSSVTLGPPGHNFKEDISIEERGKNIYLSNIIFY